MAYYRTELEAENLSQIKTGKGERLKKWMLLIYSKWSLLYGFEIEKIRIIFPSRSTMAVNCRTDSIEVHRG